MPRRLASATERRLAVERLHERLFYPPSAPPDPRSSRTLLEQLGRLAALSEFRVCVVGSLLYAPSSSRDLDLLLTARRASFIGPRVDTVERAMIACVAAGRNVAGLRVDPTYRPRGLEARLAGSLPADAVLIGWKLEDPGRTFRKAACLAPHSIDIGHASVLEVARAGDCAFYRKLPPHPRSPASRSLAPAVPIERFVRRLKESGGAWPNSGSLLPTDPCSRVAADVRVSLLQPM